MNGYRANPASIDFEVDCGPLPVRGELPSRLAGVLVRNGPNPLHPDPVQHWFAGHGMVHCFEFANGGVTYRNCWVHTQRWLAERASVAVDVGPSARGRSNDGNSAPRAERFSWQPGGGAQIARVNGALRRSTRAS
ncbi:carotenoid oxygenase family protein [Paraburkholderia sp. RL17-373-BIF-A]|uniref:carotenoid oxygenase family protein n=1 Tax=Paraburkholderia sp. RL17-373-BIF-A TaxID=3031629 RepID=UPI0038B71C74